MRDVARIRRQMGEKAHTAYEKLCRKSSEPDPDSSSPLRRVCHGLPSVTNAEFFDMIKVRFRYHRPIATAVTLPSHRSLP